MLTYLIAPLGVAAILVLWAAVELAWRRIFGHTAPGAASLASCRGCLVCTRRCRADSDSDSDIRPDADSDTDKDR